jgi:uncharacterized iron-regulated protein
MSPSTVPAAVAFGLALACAPGASRVPSPVTAPARKAEFRVFEARTQGWTEMEAVVAATKDARVMFFGEEHDDPATHRVELALVKALGERHDHVVLSLEMFERDVQPVVDRYLAGAISHEEFLARSRPWSAYMTDYHPLVELAKAHGWPVVAANVPRPLAAAVGRAGLTALDTLSPAERAYAAREFVCPDDAYRARFMEEMRTHSAGSGAPPSPDDSLPTAVAARFYLAQCVKDETMAESIASALAHAPPDALIFHVTGSFHSAYGQGTVERFVRRVPGARVVTITAVPVADPATAAAGSYAKRADFIVLTRRTTTPPGQPEPLRHH